MAGLTVGESVKSTLAEAQTEGKAVVGN
jgi:hypothetical protein